VAQVDDLCSFALQNAAHNVDGSIVTVEKSSRRYNANFMVGSKTHTCFFVDL
jgi:hypothetical protein